MAQSPASPAPASGGGTARSGTNTGTGANRGGTSTSDTRNNATTSRTAGTPSGTNTTGNNAATTTGTGTNAAGTNAGRSSTTNATGTNAFGATAPNTANTTGTSANGTGTTGSANQSGATSNASNGSAGTLSSSGTIGSFTANDFALQGNTTTSPNATPSNFLLGPDTLFTDSLGNPVPRDRFFRRGSRVPATVYYTRSPNGSLVANTVVLTENEAAAAPASVESAGTITEVSPGILVIEQPGASDTPVRYVNNKTTNYVNENGEPVPPESVKAGTPVKIFYTKVGDTLVASRVEVHRNNDGGLPKPVVPAEQSGTRPAKK